MGIDYYQQAIVGIRFSSLAFRRIINAPIWETQNRYDTKTGKVSGTEQVLVKEAEYEWYFPNTEIVIDAQDVSNRGLLWAIIQASHIDLDILEIEDYIYMGKRIHSTKSYGRFHPLEGYYSFEELEEIKQLALDNLCKIGYNKPEQFGLYFIPEIC